MAAKKRKTSRGKVTLTKKQASRLVRALKTHDAVTKKLRAIEKSLKSRRK